MSTPQEKVEAQRLAFESRNIKLRHLIGPVELEHLLLTQKDHAELLKELESIKAQFANELHTTTPKDTK